MGGWRIEAKYAGRRAVFQDGSTVFRPDCILFGKCVDDARSLSIPQRHRLHAAAVSAKRPIFDLD